MMDTPSLIERAIEHADLLVSIVGWPNENRYKAAELLREAASSLTQLTEERDDTNGFSWHERWRMAVDGANVWRDEAEALRARVADLERVLRGFVDVLSGVFQIIPGTSIKRIQDLEAEAERLLSVTEDRPAEPTP